MNSRVCNICNGIGDVRIDHTGVDVLDYTQCPACDTSDDEYDEVFASDDMVERYNFDE